MSADIPDSPPPAPSRTGRWKPLLALIALLAVGLAGAWKMGWLVPGDPDARIQALKVRLAQQIGRTECEGCPASWKVRDCNFVVESKNIGTGAEAAQCSRLDILNGRREDPEVADKDAVDRVGEATRDAGTDLSRWMEIYFLAYDLERTSTPPVVITGQIARGYVLRKVAAMPVAPGERWYRDLGRFLTEAADPRRVLYIALFNATSSLKENPSPRSIRLLETLSHEASRIQVENQDSVGAFFASLNAEFSDNIPDMETWEKELALLSDSWKTVLQRAAVTYRAEKGSCPSGVQDLSPEYIDSVPPARLVPEPLCPDPVSP